MKIEHVAMYVNDLEGAKDFFVRFFEAEVGEKYHNQEVDFHSYFLTFEVVLQVSFQIRRIQLEQHLLVHQFLLSHYNKLDAMLQSFMFSLVIKMLLKKH